MDDFPRFETPPANDAEFIDRMRAQCLAVAESMVEVLKGPIPGPDGDISGLRDIALLAGELSTTLHAIHQFHAPRDLNSYQR